MSVYSSMKFLHHPDRLDELRRGEQIVPISVHWDLCSACPQHCRFCAYRLAGYTTNQLFSEYGANGKRRMPSYDKSCEIIDDFSSMGVRGIEFTGGGESTYHPSFHDIALHALDCGLDIALVTNGVLLKPVTITLLAKRATWVRVSLDSACEYTYCHIRQVPAVQWQRAIDNLKALCQQRDEYDSRLTVGVGFVVTKDNWKEITDATLLAKECGANNIRLSAFFQSEGVSYFDEFADDAHDLCLKAESLATDRFSVFNLFANRVSDLRQGSPDYRRCCYQELVIFLGGDLTVYRCCNLAFNERGIVGSLECQTFRELWESQQKHDAYATFDARGCPRCMFNEKNRSILYAINPRPEHVNFV